MTNGTKVGTEGLREEVGCRSYLKTLIQSSVVKRTVSDVRKSLVTFHEYYWISRDVSDVNRG